MNIYLVIYHDGRVGRGNTVWTALDNAIGIKESKDFSFAQGNRGYKWSPYITRHNPNQPRSSYEYCTVASHDGTLQLLQIYRSQHVEVIKQLHQKYLQRSKKLQLPKIKDLTK